MMLGGVGFQVGLDEARRKHELEAQEAAAAAVPAPAADVVGQLKELGQLREGGVLSPEEFELAKQRILGG